MSCKMEGDVPADARQAGYLLEVPVDGLVAGYGEEAVRPPSGVVAGIAADELLGRLEQRHRHALRCLLPVVIEPHVPVDAHGDVILECELRHVGKSSAGIDTEQEDVARDGQVYGQLRRLEALQVALCKEAFFHMFLSRLEQAHGVCGQPFVLYGHVHDPFEARHVLERPVYGTADGTFAAVPLQVGEELVHEGLVNGLDGIIGDMVFDSDEIGQVLSRHQVTPVTARPQVLLFNGLVIVEQALDGGVLVVLCLVVQAEIVDGEFIAFCLQLLQGFGHTVGGLFDDPVGFAVGFRSAGRALRLGYPVGRSD